MSGDATFSGTSYQAKLIAFVYAHMLSQSRLRWLELPDDTPLGVSGESGGPGDDLRVELGQGSPPVEVQAKHGLNAGGALTKALQDIQLRTTGGTGELVVLAIAPGSSARVRDEFARDLDRIRSGRTDGLKQVTQNVVAALPEAETLLSRLFVVTVALDTPADPGTKLATHMLESALDDPGQAEAAWGVLVADANEVCAKRLRRTRKDLVQLLQGAGVRVRPPRPYEKWLRRLEVTRELIDRYHPAAALKGLAELERDLGDDPVDAQIRYKLYQHRASAYFRLGRYEEAQASGQKALDFDPEGTHAHQVVALVAMLRGDADAAFRHANRAVSSAPSDPAGWIALTQVEARFERDRSVPPPPVVEDPAYAEALVQVAVNGGEWESALELTHDALRTTRAPRLLYLRCQALAATVHGDRSSELSEEIVRLATELIQVVDDEHHPLTARALVLRGNARRMLDQSQEADDDLRRAAELSPQDPDVIVQMAQARALEGDRTSALEMLRDPVVRQHPLLLLLRGNLAAADHPEMARADLEAALRLLPDAPDPGTARMKAAELAIELDDLEEAARLLDECPALEGHLAAWERVMRARIAFANGDIDEGRSHIGDAIGLDPAMETDLTMELASHFGAAHRFQDVVDTLTPLDLGEAPMEASRMLLGALLEVHNLDEAQSLVDTLASRGALPEWAIRASAIIATKQGDGHAAVEHLRDLVAREEGSVATRFDLARHLVELERHDEANDHLKVLRETPDLTPVQMMALAQLEYSIRPSQEALDLAFEAYKRGPADPAIHKAFIGMHVLSDHGPVEADRVTASTYVKLKSERGEIRTYEVLAGPPADPLRNEITIQEAETLGLVGARVGDILRRKAGTWLEEAWTVQEVLSASHHAVQDAMAHFESRFPNEPFFLARFTIGDGSSVDAFAPFIASANERRRQVEEVLGAYKTHVLPLGMLASHLGISVPDALGTLGRDPNVPTDLYVEWSNRTGLMESLHACRDATEVVLTSSALYTMSDLNLLPALQRFRLVAPLSLEVELKDLVAGAAEDMEKGKKSMSAAPDGRLAIEDIPPGHAALAERLEERRALLAFLDGVELRPRPLQSIGPPDSEREQIRDVVGAASMDAVDLSTSRSAPMFADDLGLRKVARGSGDAGSFSSVSLLLTLAEVGDLSAEDRDRCLLELAMRRYAFIPPSASILTCAMRLHVTLGDASLEKPFALLAGPHVDVQGAADITAQTIKTAATGPVEIFTARDIARRALEAMSTRWPRSQCAGALVGSSTEVLLLLPRVLEEVQEAAASFLSAK